MIVGVGISGGVDSTAAAYLLKQAGYDVRGYTMLISDSDTTRAQEAAERLQIPLHTIDLRDQFERLIVDYFTQEYRSGKTPSPCVRCNRLFKFGLLRDFILNDGCDAMATGHYAQVINGSLHRGADPQKDQSYFLSQVPLQIFDNVIFPLGDRIKADVKELMLNLNLVPPSLGESQDLCFVNADGFDKIVLSKFPELAKRGDIVTKDGKVLGQHSGAFAYTIGQRRGLGLGGGPWFVIGVDVLHNKVTVGRQEDLYCDKVHLTHMNWLTDVPVEKMHVQAQLRYLMRPRDAVLIPTNKAQEADLIFDEPAPLVPAGQLGAAYLGTQVVASGWIN